jgi:hypothetical protein
MTFDQAWQEYCTKHKMDMSSPMCMAIKNIAHDLYIEGYGWGYNDGAADGWDAGYETAEQRFSP